MASNIIETPGIPSGNEQERLEQMYRYLCRLADDLNVNLQAIGGNDLTDEERQVMQQILVKSAEDAGVQADSISGQMLQMESLKSLIIKTAQFVQTKLDEYKLNLLRETVADGQFGKYLKRTKLDVDVTPEGIQQNYSLQETVEGLIKAEINARSYIKTGYLHDDANHLPVYGVAIGKEIVDFQADGTTVYNDGNKVAELTADELSFWYNNTKVFYISTGKIYTSGDFEILSGGKLKISAGGTLDVDTTNFKIDSANGYVQSGQFKYNSSGIQIDKTFSITGYGDINTRFILSDEDNINIPSDKYTSGILYHQAGSYNSFLDKIIYNPAIYFVRYDKGVLKSKIHIGNSTSGVGIYEMVGDFYIGCADYPISAVWTSLVRPGANSQGTTYVGINGVPFDEGHFKTIYYNTLVQSSSKDIKHNIQPMKPPGERLDQLKPVTFVYNDDKKERTRQGLIYEDTVEIMPEICTDGDKEGKAINYTELIPMLLAEVQQLRARVSELERRQDNGKETE